MNLIRVMPAKGSGLLGTEVRSIKNGQMPLSRILGEAVFFCFLLTERTMEIEVRVNGRDERLQECTIETLVARKGLVAASLVVECNGRIVKQADWSGALLKHGDVLELLNFVGGG